MFGELSFFFVLRLIALASALTALAGCVQAPLSPALAPEQGRVRWVVGDGGQTQAVLEGIGPEVEPRRSSAAWRRLPSVKPVGLEAVGVSLQPDGIVFHIEDDSVAVGAGMGALLGSHLVAAKGRMRSIPVSDEPGKTPVALQRWIQNVPGLSWPPPAPSGRLVLPSRTGAWAERRGLTLGEVASQVQAAMTDAGYLERSYFPVPEGFALVTRIEQIDANGAPKVAVARWNVESPAAGDSFFSKLLKGMTGAPSGLYRLFIFVVTTDDHSPTGTEPSYDDAKGWFVRGAAGPSNAMEVTRVTARHRMSVLVYEFETFGGRNVKALLPGKLACETHLKKAGLWLGLSRLAGDTPVDPVLALSRDHEEL